MKAFSPWTVLIVAASAALVFACLAQPAASEETPEDASIDRAIAEAAAELDAERADWKKAEAEFESAKAALGSEIEALERDILALAGTIEAQERKAAELAASCEEIARVEEESGRKLDALAAFAAQGIESMKTVLEISVPHSERDARIAFLSRLDADARAGSSPASLVSGYFRLMAEEAELGSSSEVFRSPVLLDSGEQKEADVLRLGRIFCGYVTADRKQAGLLFRSSGDKAGWSWKEGEEGLVGTMSEAVDACGNPDRRVGLPLDVTMDLPPEMLGGGKDIATFLISGGPVMIPLLLSGLAALLMILERLAFLALNRPHASLVEKAVLLPLKSGNVEAAEAGLKPIRGPLARPLRAGMAARGLGQGAIEAAFTAAASAEMASLERFLSAIAAMAVVAPLLGLLGTVTGMISTFDVITIFGTGDPRLLSGGISEALVTTEVGLIIAIPVMLVHSWLSTRATSLVQRIEIAGASMVSSLCSRNRDPGEGGESA